MKLRHCAYFCVLAISFLVTSSLSTAHEIDRTIKTTSMLAGPVRLVLPDVIYALPGKEINVYLDNVVLCIDSRQYAYDVKCSKGMQFDECWTYTPAEADVGEYDFILEVRDNSNSIIAKGRSKLHVSPANAGAGKEFTMLMIGDSLTYASVYPEWLLHNCTGLNEPNITLIGSHGPNGQPCDKIKHEGYGGWRADHFANLYTGIARSGPNRSRTCGSPFIYADPNAKPALNFSRYCTEYNHNRAPDYVTIFLGCNDVFGATDENLESCIDSILINYTRLLTMIHDHDKNIRIGIMLPVPPSSSQDAFGANYKCDQTRWQYKRNQHRLVERMLVAYGNKEHENVFIVPAYVNLDTVHNYPVYGSAPYNKHTAAEGVRQRDSVHPDVSGYRQIGDSVYFWLKAICANDVHATNADYTGKLMGNAGIANQYIGATSKAGPEGRLFVGTARVNITTDQKGVIVNDPLFAKVLVLSDGSTKLAIIAMDALAVGGIGDVNDTFLPNLRTRIHNELDIPAMNVLVNASHTHPPGRLLCDADELLLRVFTAVKHAQENMVAVKIGSGIGHENGLTINRTLRLKNGKHWTIRHTYPCPPDNEVSSLGPVDNRIGIIRIDRVDGSPLAVLYNFACHPLLGKPGGPVTANYPGFASKVIEEQLGPNAMAFFLQGAAGDVCESQYKNVNQPRDAEPFGKTLAMDVLQAYQNLKPETVTLNVLNVPLQLPRRTDIPGRLKSLHKQQSELLASLRYTSLNFKTFIPLYIKYSLGKDFPADYSYRYLQERDANSDSLLKMDAENTKNIQKYLHNVQVLEDLAKIQDDIETLEFHQDLINKDGGKPFATEIMGIRIGDCVILTCAAEMLTQVGLDIKRTSPYTKTFIAAYSNGYLYYGPPADYYDKGGYEVTECELAPEWQRIFQSKADEIMKRL